MKKDTMNPKPLDAGLAERLCKIYSQTEDTCLYDAGKAENVRRCFEALADEVRRIVKEAKEGE